MSISGRTVASVDDVKLFNLSPGEKIAPPTGLRSNKLKAALTCWKLSFSLMCAQPGLFDKRRSPKGNDSELSEKRKGGLKSVHVSRLRVLIGQFRSVFFKSRRHANRPGRLDRSVISLFNCTNKHAWKCFTEFFWLLIFLQWNTEWDSALSWVTLKRLDVLFQPDVTAA